MKTPAFFKAGIGCGVMIVLGLITLFIFVLYRQHAYKTMPDTHDLKARINNLAIDYLAHRTNGALVIGVIQHGKPTVFGFGRVSETNSATPDGETIFEIGSITKVLTAITLARMVNDGTVKLEDPISRFLPPGVTAPQKDGREIVLGHLATHTAGLPRLPDDMLANATGDSDPYAHYNATNMFASLATIKLKTTPGTKSSYSNFGFGLLGHLLATKAGKSYESLVHETVCDPLAMSNTVITLSDEQKLRLAPGHDPKGALVPNWEFDALAGCGAFRSTVNDLLKLIDASLHDGTNATARAIAETRRMQFKEFAGGLGLAWQIRKPAEGQTWHWHNGGTGGYISFTGFDQPNQVGVVVLSNYGDGMVRDNSLDLLGVAILRFLPKISLE